MANPTADSYSVASGEIMYVGQEGPTVIPTIDTIPDITFYSGGGYQEFDLSPYITDVSDQIHDTLVECGGWIFNPVGVVYDGVRRVLKYYDPAETYAGIGNDRGDIWYLTATYGDTNTLRIPSEYVTLADAYTSMESGDTIEIDPGTYSGSGWYFTDREFPIRGWTKSGHIKSSVPGSKVIIENDGTVNAEGYKAALLIGIGGKHDFDVTLTDVRYTGFAATVLPTSSDLAAIRGSDGSNSYWVPCKGQTLTMIDSDVQYSDNGILYNGAALTITETVAGRVRFSGNGQGREGYTHAIYYGCNHATNTGVNAVPVESYPAGNPDGVLSITGGQFDGQVAISDKGHYVKCRVGACYIYNTQFGDPLNPDDSDESRAIDMPLGGDLLVSGVNGIQGANSKNREFIAVVPGLEGDAYGDGGTWPNGYENNLTWSIAAISCTFENRRAQPPDAECFNTETQCVNAINVTITGFNIEYTGGTC